MKRIDFTELPKNNFIYPVVFTLAFSVHGINDIFTRSFILNFKKIAKNQVEYSAAVDRLYLSDSVKAQLKNVKTLTPLINVPEFRKKNSPDFYYFDVDQVSLDITPDKIVEVYKHVVSLAENIIIVGYQKLMTINPKDSDVLEFFRHIRNAAAHNGRFYFKQGKNGPLDVNGQLKKKASWNGFVIDGCLNNSLMFNVSKSSEDKFWDLGDLIEFLLDIENYYPEIKKNLS